MTAILRELAALLFSTAILITGNGLINTLLPVRAEIEASSTLAHSPSGIDVSSSFSPSTRSFASPPQYQCWR